MKIKDNCRHCGAQIAQLPLNFVSLPGNEICHRCMIKILNASYNKR